MPTNRLEVRDLTLPSGVIKQSAQQIARDIQVSIAEGISTISRTPAPMLDEVAKVVVDYVRTRQLPTRRPRLIGRRARFVSREVVEHARRYQLTRRDSGTSVLKSRTAAQLMSDYAWAARELSEAYFNSIYASLSLSRPDLGVLADIPAAAPQQPPYVSVSFRVWRVDCVDETGMEALGGEAGHDEIRMGATTVNAQGLVEKVSDFKVKDFEQDGDFRFYDDSKVIKKFPIGADWSFPQTNVVFLHLAESDQGGFGDFLHDFYEAIKEHVVGVLVGAGTSIGAAYGATLGTIGGPIGVIVGAIVGAILGFLIGWLIEALKDDIFESQSSVIQIPSITDNFNGSDRSPVYSLTYKGHDGEYVVYYDWVLATS